MVGRIILLSAPPHFAGRANVHNPPTCYPKILPAWSPGMTAPALATAVGVSGAALGLWLTGLRHRARVVVPLSAGVLLGVAVFGLPPDLTTELGRATSLI